MESLEIDAGEQIEIADDGGIGKYTTTVVRILRKYGGEKCAHTVRHSSIRFKILNNVSIMFVFNVVLLLLSATTGGNCAALPDTDQALSPPTVLPSVTVSSTTQAVADSASATSAAKICHANTPCGWAVYVPFTRRVDYFMKNICVCPTDKACLRHDDDLSVSAYVYRCGEKTGTTEVFDVPVY